MRIFIPHPFLFAQSARAVLGDPKPMAETNRDAAKAAKTKIVHEGRPDVERTVPVIPKKP